jgi:hypothetical protein
MCVSRRPPSFGFVAQPRNRHGNFKAQITKPELSVLRPQTEKLEPPVLRLNQRKPSPSVLRANWRKTVRVVLRSNHSQTVDLGFEAQLRNPRFSCPHAWCRSHTVPPDLSITRPPSTRPVRPSLVLRIRFPTPAMILVTARHAAAATCTPQDEETRFST